MIPVNFSITREAVTFIYEQRESEASNSVIKFVQKELITRVVGVSLSALQLLDLGIHAFGVVESTFYSIYRGIFEHKPIDFSLPLKHIKCLKVFAESFLSSSFAGLIDPGIKTFSKMESKQVSSIRGLLLSRDEEHYTENCHINALNFVTYVQSLADKLSPEEKVGMEDTIELLKETKGLLQDFDMLKHQKLALDGYLSKSLADVINNLVKRDSTLLEKIVFKECLSRILALGLSFAAAIDVVIRILITTIAFVEMVLLDILVTKGHFFQNDIKEIGRFFLYHLRDIAFSIVGAFSGSLVGVVSPSLACKIATPSSGFYDNFRFSAEDILNSVLENAKGLDVGKSILVPIILPCYFGSHDANHFVTILVKKDEEARYTVSVINKGYGSNHEAEAVDLSKEKIPINVTRNDVTTTELKLYLREVIKMGCITKKDFVEKIKRQVETHNEDLPEEKRVAIEKPEVLNYIIDQSLLKILYRKDELGTLVKNPSDLLGGKTQTTGDCSKASLLGALHYHSCQKNKDSNSYKKFLNNIKKRALEEDGHLLDIALSGSLTKEKPSVAAKKRVNRAAPRLLSLNKEKSQSSRWDLATSTSRRT